MLIGHKIRLNPTDEQAQFFFTSANVARRAFNWGLGQYNQKQEGQTITIVGKGETLIWQFRTLKNQDITYPFDGHPIVGLALVSSYAYQGAFADLKSAISRYFDQKKKGNLTPPKGWKGRKDKKPYGWPRFKGRFKTTPNFYQANTCIEINEHWVKLQKCPGEWVNMAEPVRFDGRIKGARISYAHNYWWMSLSIDLNNGTPLPLDTEAPLTTNDIVGIDLGIRYLATTSGPDVIEYENPKPLIKAQTQLRRLQRKMDRQARKDQNNWSLPYSEQSNNWKKTKSKINKMHYRIYNLRKEAAHLLTTELARQYKIVVLEDLNVKGMLKNRRLSRTISDAAFYEKRRQLEYKTLIHNGLVIVISRWFPSSKKCECGWINTELKQGDIKWLCNECGRLNLRDQNAADRIKEEGIRILQESGHNILSI